MNDAEVICISSDDDDEPQRDCNNKQTSEAPSLFNSTKQEVIKPVSPKGEVEVENLSVPNNISVPKKREGQYISNNESGPPVKKFKVSMEKPDTNAVESTQSSPCRSNGSLEDNNFTLPLLVVKEKRSISPDEQHAFSMFLNLCRQKDRGKDMQKIIDKLEKKYKRLDEEYKKSEAFNSFLADKRFAMMDDKKNTYTYIYKVMTEMKARIHGSSSLLTNHNTTEEKDDNSEEDDPEVKAKNKRIARIDRAMRKCDKIVQKLEVMESDLNDEDSTYIKVERYKARIIQLFNQRCKLTGESVDAGRSYLKPRNLKPTGVAAIDEAITRLVNAKILKRNKLKKNGTGVDALIFPNYSDILECIQKCNDTGNMGFTTSRLEHVAKTAFTQLGEYLQRVRRTDYWETFSLYLDSQQDPATNDPLLAAKLSESQKEGQKRLATVFQKYVDEQEKLKTEDIEAEEEVDTDRENESEDSNDEDEDDLESKDLSEAESEEEDPHPTKNNTENGDTECASEQNSGCKGTDDAVATAIPPNPTSNSTATAEPDESSESKEERSHCDEAKINNEHTQTPTKQTNTSDKLTPDALTTTGVPTDVPLSIPTPSTVPRRVSEEKNKPDGETEEVVNSTRVEVIFDELESWETENDEEQECENEENTGNFDAKPLLRLRSFAKPPTTWNDGEQRQAGSPVRAKAADSKVDVVDLTLTPVATKPTVTKERPQLKTFRIVANSGNLNNNGESATGKVIKVLQPSNVTVLNQVLHSNGSTMRVAKSLTNVKMINIGYTDRKGHQNHISLPLKRVQPQNITALRPSTSKMTSRNK